MGVDLSIVIPVYNEGSNIKKTLRIISEKIYTNHQIIIIYDFDSDNTLPVLKSLSKEYSNLQIIKNIYGNGALNAIKTGFKISSGRAVLVVMADLADDLSIVDEMYQKIIVGYDIVCGSRYMKGGKQIGGPRIKKLLSSLAGRTLHYLIKIPTYDITNSFKMYSKQLLEIISIKSNGGFELGMEITIKAYINNYLIAELPTTWRDRSSGESRFKLLKWLTKYFYWYLYGVTGYILKKLYIKGNIL